MSSIYQMLGADEASLPLLWLAAPLTGLLVQPIIVRGVRHKLLIFHCVEQAFEFIKHLMPEPAREPLLSSKP